MTLWPWLLGVALAWEGPAPAPCDLTPPEGDPEVWLITASPGGLPFTFIGHASLWLRDPARGIDHVWEYGVFDSRKQEPLSSLLLGTLQCGWHVPHVRREIRDYERLERTAVAQQLRLSDPALQRLETALGDIRAHPERADRFHWRQNSCSTKVRDVLDDALLGALRPALADPAPLTPRQEVMRHLAQVPWAWLGLQLLGGAPVDAEQSRWDAAFIPLRMAQDLEAVPLGDGGGGLAGPRCTLNAGAYGWPAPRPPSRTGALLALGLAGAAGMVGLDRAARRPGALATGARALGGVLYAALGLVLGVLGSALAALWAASTLDDFGPNHALFVAHPASLLLVGLGTAWALGRRPAWGRPASRGLAALALLGLALSLLPGWPQQSAAALALLAPLVASAAAWGRPAQPPTGGNPSSTVAAAGP